MRTVKPDRANGQSLVLIALMLVSMLAFLGLVIDGGRVLANRRNSQDASDAAAFAGVRQLVLRPTDSVTVEQSIWNTITTVEAANGITSTTDIVASFIDQSGNDICQINQNCLGVPVTPTLATGIRVTSTLRLQPYFISLVVGNAVIPIQSVAAVQSGTPSVGSDLMPVSVPWPCPPYTPETASECTYFSFGTPFALQGGKTQPGGFQWLDFQCGTQNPGQAIPNYLTRAWTSGDVLADKSDKYYNPSHPTDWNVDPPPPPSPSPWVCGSSGFQPNSQVQNALDCWLNLGSGCWGAKYGPWGPQPSENKWDVVIFDQSNGLGGTNAMFHVVMIGRFQLLGYWFANNQCNWEGKTQSESCDPSKGDLPDVLKTCATAVDPNDPPGTKNQCIEGQFLKEVINAQIIPSACNTIGLDGCAFGLSQ